MPKFDISILDLLTHMQKNEGDDKITGIGRRQEEEDKVTELPEIPQLQHLAKNRPKRPKKHASTKNVVKVAIFFTYKYNFNHAEHIV